MKKETIVDRIEEDKAVLVTDDEETIILPADWFEDIYEGMAIDITFKHNEGREKDALSEAEDLLAEIKRMNGDE